MGLKIDKNQLYEKWKRQEGQKITEERQKKKAKRNNERTIKERDKKNTIK